MTDNDVYLIWSHEHCGWWRPDMTGYTPRLSEAGHYTRAAAIGISMNAIPGTAHRLGVLPELPVCLADVKMMRSLYRKNYPVGPEEPWE